jgi:phosphoglycolate phosphatase-like HAD superfamily hydrolase
MTANEIRGVTFDLDGTLIDSYQAIYLGFHHAYTQMGLSPMSYEQVKRVVGLGLDHTFRELLGEERVSRGLLLFRKKYEEVFRENTRLLPDAREVLETLHGRGIRLALEKMGVEKERTIFVGDSVIDIQTGKNAGVRVFAVPTGNTDRRDLENAQPAVMLDQLLDLLSYV